MKIHFFCPRWGSEALDWEPFCEKAKMAGYDGIEMGIAADTSAKTLDRVWTLAEKYHLLLLPQHYDTVTPDFERHIRAYHSWLERVSHFPAYKINSQTGRDHFSFEQNKILIELGIHYGVLHETHRGKFSFAAHITRLYLDSIKALKLTLDISHWVCVAASLLEDQQQTVDLALQRTEHIHARIGFSEGPQVPDPRQSEWAAVLNKHCSWWDEVAARKEMTGEALSITPEFGPFPYMTHLPSTGEPITDQWEVNRFMMELLRERYG